MLRLLLLSLSFLSLTTASTWKGCYEEGETTAKVFKGEKTPVCLLISDQSSWKEETLYYRFLFTPKVDEFTKLDVDDCKYWRSKAPNGVAHGGGWVGKGIYLASIF